MAHFWGRLRGRFGKKVTNIGSSSSGIRAVVNGFQFGVIVELRKIGEEDKAEIFLTNGCNAEIKPISIGTFSHSNLKKMDKKIINPLRRVRIPLKNGGK